MQPESGTEEGAPAAQGAPQDPTGTEPASTSEAAPLEGSEQGATEATAEPLDVNEFGDRVVTVKVDGEDQQVPLKEALAGYQRQSDYTRKTQELAEQRAAVEQFEQLQAAMRADPEGTLRRIADQLGVSLGEAREAVEEELDPVEQELREVKDFMERSEREKAEAELNRQLEELHDTYGEFDDQEFITYVVENNLGSLDEAIKGFTYDQAIEKARQEQQERKEQEENSRLEDKANLPPIEGGKTPASSSVATDKAPASSVKEAFAEALKQHRGA